MGTNCSAKTEWERSIFSLWRKDCGPIIPHRGRLCIRFLKRQEYFSSFPVFYCLEIFEKGEKKAPSPLIGAAVFRAKESLSQKRTGFYEKIGLFS